MSVMERRADAVNRTVEEIRRIAGTKGVTRATLAEVETALIELAGRSELFPPAQFPVTAGRGGNIYHLAEDADHSFALYASAGAAGKAQPPHNHTTWAVISGVHGDEHNVFYARTDNGATPGRGTLRKTGERTVRRGNAVAFLPDDFHTIEVHGGGPTLHLHMYGRSLEHLPDRVYFDSPAGDTYKRFMAKPEIFASLVEARELKAMLSDGRELALLDVREEGVFSERHLLFASSLPLSRLELGLDALVPRRSTRIVLCDDNDGLAQRAAAKLRAFGYRNIAVLAGGVAAWSAAGYELFSGVNVPSKAFGEFVEHRDDTPRLPAAEVKAKLDAGDDIVILDSRPMSEFRVMNIPSGIDCAGAELVYRAFDQVKSPDTLVVVNCAGRTRSIIGAQSLINAGFPNRVVALKDGTMGWHLAGFALEHGESRRASAPGPAGRAKAQAAAAQVAKRFGVREIDRDALARFAAEQGTRTLYLFDVRSPEEYEAGHMPGARSAPGGQLVQATDTYAATRNARVVLIDDDGVRARMTASWLIQMGWDEIYVLRDAMSRVVPERGGEHVSVLGLNAAIADMITPGSLKQLVDDGRAVVIDLDTSLRYRAGHIPGAWFAVRSRLGTSLDKIPRAGTLVLASRDGVLARLAAPEAAALANTSVKVLAGGTAAWRAAELPLEIGETRLADTPNDVWRRPYDRGGDVESAMRAYLSWEVDLVRQIERDGDARFRRFPSV